MDDIFGLVFRLVNSVLLAKYYSWFLTPKSNRFPRHVVFIGFGITFFIVQYLAFYLFLLSGLDISAGIVFVNRKIPHLL